MLLQTNSYIVPQDKRAEHARLLRRFRQVLARLGCDSFEVYEQVGSNWNAAELSGRVVQIMRFRDRRHQLAVQAAERNDPIAQAVIAEFCNLINFPYQQQQGLFAVGFYNAVLPAGPARAHEAPVAEADDMAAEEGGHGAAAAVAAGAGAAAVAAAAHAEAVESETIFPPPVEAPDAASPVEVPLDAPVPHDAAVGALAPEEPLSGKADASPALQAEEPLFAEGTEGILGAAEQLPDEALDAGGDAAVADAIAAASAEPAGDTPSVDTAAEVAAEATAKVEAEQLPAGGPESEEPETAAFAPEDEATAAEPGTEDDLDLAALLDPHLGSEEQQRPEAGGNRAAEAHADWDDALSLDGVLDDDEELGRDEDQAAKDAVLEPEPEHDRNHVSR